MVTAYWKFTNTGSSETAIANLFCILQFEESTTPRMFEKWPGAPLGTKYLLELLEARGFSSRWRDWISLILASSSSMVLMNGILGPKFHHERGLRQGDPLSPYLFILAIDTIQRIFEAATEEGNLSPRRGGQAKLRLS